MGIGAAAKNLYLVDGSSEISIVFSSDKGKDYGIDEEDGSSFPISSLIFAVIFISHRTVIRPMRSSRNQPGAGACCDANVTGSMA